MRSKVYLFLFVLSLFFSCKKDNSTSVGKKVSLTDTSHTLTLAQVKTWYTAKGGHVVATHLSASKDSQLTLQLFDWAKIKKLTGSHAYSWIAAIAGQPTYQNVKQGYRKIVFYLDSAKQIHANILEIIPDGLYIQRNLKATTKTFTGRVFIYDQQYKLLGGLILANGKLVGQIRSSTITHLSNTGPSNKLRVADLQSCSWTQNSYIDGEGIFTCYTYEICDEMSFAPSDIGGGFPGYSGDVDYLSDAGGGGGAIDSAPTVPNLPSETKPGIDSKKLMDCFSNIPKSGVIMKVTVYVQEPFPGTSFNIGPNSVGHVAVGLTEIGSGMSITQVVGFYPNASGLSKMHAPSKIVDNGGDFNYDVSSTYSVNAVQFTQIINYISNPPSTYDITDFNCTNFVYNACQAGGITLPNAYNTIGLAGPGGASTAMTPAGLGSSMENLSNSSTVNKTGGYTPFSKGPCN